MWKKVGVGLALVGLSACTLLPDREAEERAMWMATYQQQEAQGQRYAKAFEPLPFEFRGVRWRVCEPGRTCEVSVVSGSGTATEPQLRAALRLAGLEPPTTGFEVTRAPAFPVSQAQTGPLRAEVRMPRTAQMGQMLTLAVTLHNETRRSVSLFSGERPLNAVIHDARGEAVRWYTSDLISPMEFGQVCPTGPCHWDRLQLNAPLDRFNRWLPLPPGEYTVTVRMTRVFADEQELNLTFPPQSLTIR
ncbi:hypothetical protein K7W42_18180 [Deinococcus sp. HMF7604]|uniref:hypothetical protein n=1 Tax=Deinococcus betulae TaxID=2873312 RepID=UPI001CCA8C64|nr:hypothetical protein [Deinococcus betulae]MBZ9752771.1 hypothetical protein [Deinococcus betulae]